ncbi:hypothetical protein [Bradyrhizobium vignae]|uniref:hypothetical protein n=1 Tax=Bradyrhizobium vignae TaxID=1549949 RepID=UPI00100A4252|nr:hypothetical protein [Bradyrhizobium vignae]RXG97205.1 hypothetical protein EAV90_22860 [Bradyrhizobium vignae]
MVRETQTSNLSQYRHNHFAAAQKDWFYPEQRVSTDHWRKLGDGYLLMPEPRLIHMGGEILIGYKGRGSR